MHYRVLIQDPKSELWHDPDPKSELWHETILHWSLFQDPLEFWSKIRSPTCDTKCCPAVVFKIHWIGFQDPKSELTKWFYTGCFPIEYWSNIRSRNCDTKWFCTGVFTRSEVRTMTRNDFVLNPASSLLIRCILYLYLNQYIYVRIISTATSIYL